MINLAVTITPSFCQYAFQTGLRPDVRFDEDNDRFDVTNLIRRQTKHFKPNLDSQSLEEYRRRYKPKLKNKHKDKGKEQDLPWPKLISSEAGRSVLRKKIKAKLEDHVNNLANTIIHKIRGLRRTEHFAYHANMDSAGGDVDDFNANLQAIENFRDLKIDEINEDEVSRRQTRLQGIVNNLHGTKETRRTALDPEKEILFHYAFPVDMKIEGFLQAPDI